MWNLGHFEVIVYCIYSRNIYMRLLRSFYTKGIWALVSDIFVAMSIEYFVRFEHTMLLLICKWAKVGCVWLCNCAYMRNGRIP
jgi:hypothetical protein